MANTITMVFKAATTQARAEVNKLKKDIADTDSTAQKFGTGVKGVGSTMGMAMKAGAAVGGAALVAYGMQAFQTGRQLETMGAKSSAVFDESLPKMQAWAEGVAGAMGMTEERLLGAAAGFADLLIPMGFTAEQASGMTQDVIELSGALSAWSAGKYNATEVSQILAKAMLGEREQLKELGISITEADVQARLAAKGQAGLTGATLAQAKAIATQELIMEKSLDAQQAWNDGTFDGIKAQNEAAAAIQETKDNLSDLLYDAIKPAIPFVTQLAEGAANISSGFENWAEPTSVVEENLRDLLRTGGDLDTVLAELEKRATGGDSFWDRLNPFTSKNGELLDNYDELKERIRQAFEEGEKFAALDMGWQEQQEGAQQMADVLSGDVRSGTQAARLKLDQYNDELERNVELIDDVTDELYGYETAQLDVADAVADMVTKQEEAAAAADDEKLSVREKEQAYRDAIRAQQDAGQSAFDAAQKYAQQQGAVDGTKESIDLMVEELERQKRKYPELRGEIDKYIAKLRAIPHTVSTAIKFGNTTVGKGGIIDFGVGGGIKATDALGTSSAAPGVHLVGEHGPELVTMNGGEKVFTAGRTEHMLRNGASTPAGGAGLTINMYGTSATPEQVVSAIRQYERRNGTSWRS